MKLIFKLILIIVPMFMLCEKALADNTIEHTKIWTSAVIVGPLTTMDDKIKYYLEPRFRLMDDKYKLEEASLYAGLGYQFRSNLTVFVGLTRAAQIDLNGSTLQENRIWQQIDWNAFKTKMVKLTSRTRFEERKNLAEPEMATRLREKLSARFALDQCNHYSFVLFDELFFNINHPRWVSNRFIAENRAFAGIGTQLFKHTLFDIGYMNQYKFANTNRIANILYSSFDIKFE